MNTPLQDATALTERIQDMLHHAPEGSQELAICAEALSHLQHCCDALAKLPEPQYRMLEVGERIEEGDEFKYHNGLWCEVLNSVGTKLNFAPKGCFRRRIKPNPQYRMLEVGEMIQEGDQFYMGVWLPVEYAIGHELRPEWVGEYRRRIATAQDFRDIENMLTRCNSVYAQGLKQGEKA
jgi:hypothetical protein